MVANVSWWLRVDTKYKSPLQLTDGTASSALVFTRGSFRLLKRRKRPSRVRKGSMASPEWLAIVTRSARWKAVYAGLGTGSCALDGNWTTATSTIPSPRTTRTPSGARSGVRSGTGLCRNRPARHLRRQVQDGFIAPENLGVAVDG